MTMNNLKYCATTLTSGGKTRLGKIYKHAIEYLTLKNKSGSTYTITNNMPFSVTVEYNTKKCNWNDGYN